MKIARRCKWVLLLLAGVFALKYTNQLEWLSQVIAQEITKYPLIVNKYALDANGNRQTSAKADDIVKYVIDYGVDSGWQGSAPSLSGLQFVDTLSSDMELLGPLKTPPKWTAVDGGDTALRFSMPPLIPGQQSTIVPSTVDTLQTAAGGGDGYAPIIYHSADGRTNKFFEIYHHADVGTEKAKINCQDYYTGNACAGYPKSLYTSAAKTTADIGTTLVVRTVQIGQKLYYPALSNPKVASKDSTIKGMGIGCWDMQADTSCDYVHLTDGSTSGTDSLHGRYVGVVTSSLQPKKLFATFNGVMYCHDAASNNSCGAEKVIDAGTAGLSDILASDKYMFVEANGKTTCADVTTLPSKKCPGTWPQKVQTVVGSTTKNSAGNYYTNLHPYLNSSGALAGVCSSWSNGFKSWANKTYNVLCWDLAGNAVTVPALLKDAPSIYLGTSIVVPGAAKVLYPSPANDGKGGAVHGSALCWDFTSNSACAGFTDGGTGAKAGLRRWDRPNASGTGGNIGTTSDYAYTYDAGCIFGLGDSGALWSFDPDTGTAPCAKTSSTVLVPDPAPFCDGLDHGVAWDRVELNNTPAEIRSVTIKAYDPTTCTSANADACTPIGVGQATASATPDRPLWKIPFESAIAYKQYPSLLLKIDYGFANGARPANYPDFSIRTLYKTDTVNGPIAQVCATAKVLKCPAARIDNLATILSSQGEVLGRGFVPLKTPSSDPLYSDSAVGLNSNILSESTRAYHATYRRSDWSGDLTAYPFDLASASVDEANPQWSAADQLPDFDKRKIYTSTAQGAGNGIPFAYDSLSTAQRGYFGSTVQDQKEAIAYLSGDRTYEVGRAPNNRFRYRSKVLGDIVHSEPLYYNNAVYVQANDGMLHALDASTGVELFGYIPNAVLPHLAARTLVSYKHQYLMDGQMAVGTVSGKSLLVGSTGGIAPAIFALDVSASPATAASVVKWENTSTYLGRASGHIQIANLDDGTPVALIGNGMGSQANTAALLVVNLNTGVISAIDTGAGTATAPNGLSAPAIVVDRGVLKAVYAGDMQGNLWRFAVTSATQGSALKLFQGDSLKPISAAPAVTNKVLMSGLPGYMVYFGTGKPVDRRDMSFDPNATAETAMQSVYGLFDQDSNNTAISASDLVIQSYTEQTMTVDEVSQSVRTMTSKPVKYTEKKGWVLNLATTRERVVSRPLYRDNRVAFVTTIPYLSDCGNAAVNSWFMEVDASTGGQTAQQVFASKFATTATVVNGVQIDGTLAGISNLRGKNERINITSTAEPKPGDDRIDDVKTRPLGGTLIRTSWRQLF
jgi:hypothetical protein